MTIGPEGEKIFSSAVREFEKAYSEINNKGETSESNTKTSNTK